MLEHRRPRAATASLRRPCSEGIRPTPTAYVHPLVHAGEHELEVAAFGKGRQRRVVGRLAT